jgi:hypothetical protein
MKHKRYDPITYRYPRTVEEAFGEDYGPIEGPQEPSLLRWWVELYAAVMVVLFCVLVVRVVA